MTKEQILESLKSNSTVKIRKAAIELRKNPVEGVCELLHDAYNRDLDSKNSWETQSELIVTAGLFGCKSFLLPIKTICDNNIEHDLITSRSGLSYVRLKRVDLSDVSPVLEYLEGAKYSLGFGMLYALGYDKMVPTTYEQAKIIKYFWNFGMDRNGYSDPRYGLAAACAGWDKEIVRDFLNHCIKTGDKYLINVAESALKGKYVKNHIYLLY
jgi:hypothetical protein